MWILNFLPTWIVYLITAVGALGLLLSYFTSFFAKFFPQLIPIKLPLRIISTLVLILGIYLWGGKDNQEMWEAKVKEMEEKVKIAEEKSQKINTELETKVVEKTKIIREKGKTQIEYINRLVKGDTVEIVKDMSEDQKQEFLAKQKELQDALTNCPVPKIIVEEHNKATNIK